jgi:hypothetical protein
MFLRTEIGLLGYGHSLPEMMKQLGLFDRVNLESALSEPRSILDGKKVAADSLRCGLTATSIDTSENITLAKQVAKKSDTPIMHHHHASLLKIINKTGSLFRGLGPIMHFATGSFCERGDMPHAETSALSCEMK